MLVGGGRAGAGAEGEEGAGEAQEDVVGRAQVCTCSRGSYGRRSRRLLEPGAWERGSTARHSLPRTDRRRHWELGDRGWETRAGVKGCGEVREGHGEAGRDWGDREERDGAA